MSQPPTESAPETPTSQWKYLTAEPEHSLAEAINDFAGALDRSLLSDSARESIVNSYALQLFMREL